MIIISSPIKVLHKTLSLDYIQLSDDTYTHTQTHQHSITKIIFIII